jgi:hypothetical protein
VKYTMEQQRVETPIAWRRGKGVIGVAWEQISAVVADLTEMYATLERDGPEAFGARDEGFRYGLSAEEVVRGGHYKSVLAYPLTNVDNDVIGVISVDCTVPDQTHRLSALLEDRGFNDVLGACESALRRYTEERRFPWREGGGWRRRR